MASQQYYRRRTEDDFNSSRFQSSSSSSGANQMDHTLSSASPNQSSLLRGSGYENWNNVAALNQTISTAKLANRIIFVVVYFERWNSLVQMLV